VFVVVAAAMIFVGRRLWRQIQGRGCEDCGCGEKHAKGRDLVRIGPRRDKKPE
jgi:hypothetical protein